MKRNMQQWMAETIANPKKKGMPVLSFPGTQLLGYTVEELVKSGEFQAQCMKAVADRFDTGAAFSLMDLSVEAEAFGSSIHYSDNEVPTVQEALIHEDRPVLAGIIGPYSLAGRLLDMTEIMILCYEEPEMVETVLEKVTRFQIAYAKAFKEAGADGICMAEPAAGLLSPALIVVPLMENMSAIDASAYSFGNAIDIEEALKVLPADRMVLGNIDPAGTIRNGDPKQVYAETLMLLERCGRYPNFVISSGCDIPAMAPLDNIQAFFDAVETFYGRR